MSTENTSIFSKIRNASFSSKFIILGSILAVVMILGSASPALMSILDFGALEVLKLMALFMTVLFIGVLHVCRKALFDYVRMGDLYNEALKGNIAAAIVFGGICIAMVAIAIVVAVAVLTFGA